MNLLTGASLLALAKSIYYCIHSVCALQFTLFKWQSLVDTQHFHFGAEVLSFVAIELKHSILFLFLIDALLVSFLV